MRKPSRVAEEPSAGKGPVSDQVVIEADHAALFSASISLNQCASRFQLVLFWPPTSADP
jgi:hypothetical protein